MGERTAFFYGTLMAREILYRVIYGDGQVSRDPAKALLASQLIIRPAILHDHCRRRVRDADYPGVIPQAGHTVRGTYVTGLTDGDIYRLDRFEGGEYTRKFVTVKIDGIGEGEEVQAETYMYTEGEQFLETKEWDYEQFRKEKLHRWTGTSPEFADVDEFVVGDASSQSDRPDPNGGRGIRSNNEEMVEGEDADEEVLRSA